ncbi:hypothetical protein EYZ11_010881 [Aspergillus tanneri]|uniref:Uncharacterized protein n=1 Tax=Aspergillus tanneri TaxID=1220188 RepID=A0A4S3J4A2_9EURO|nr:hypothetical protein EYZ11_010881 [Aspergillus tanneri]
MESVLEEEWILIQADYDEDVGLIGYFWKYEGKN